MAEVEVLPWGLASEEGSWALLLSTEVDPERGAVAWTTVLEGLDEGWLSLLAAALLLVLPLGALGRLRGCIEGRLADVPVEGVIAAMQREVFLAYAEEEADGSTTASASG